MPDGDAIGEIMLELSLSPDDVGVLLRQPELRRPGDKRNVTPRGSRISLVWYDTPEAELAGVGQSLTCCQFAGVIHWQLHRLVPAVGSISPPGAPAVLLSETETQPPGLPEPLLPLCAFEGQRRVLMQAGSPLGVVLLQGELRAVAATLPVCRVLLIGEAAFATARRWSAAMRLAAPAASLAACGHALARGTAPIRPLGPPSLAAAETTSDGFAAVAAHLAGVLVHHASLVEIGGKLEPVHQMRVALRRLRSAMLLFRRAVGCPALDETTEALRLLGKMLGPARDWDVFATGTGTAIGAAFPDDPGIAALLAAASRKRVESYHSLVTYLAGAEWRALGITLAELALTRPWLHVGSDSAEDAARREELQQRKLHAFAARALQRRLEAVIAPGPDLSALPVEALHDIRLHCKRLRYAAEFFAPLFPGRATNRFLRRMAALQERLGHLNDGAVASTLVQSLPGRGAAHHTATGIVRGFVAAGSQGSRRKIERVWQRFLRQDIFWK
jgi:CHAD domain-containing protein